MSREDIQSVVETPTLEEILGSESPIIVQEPQLEEQGKRERAQLRSLPFFIELGIDKFLYDDLWAREFQLVAHRHLDPIETAPEEVQFPMVHLATSDQLLPRHKQEFEYEDISQADLTWELFRVTTQEQGNSPYILVTDTDSPQIPSRTPVAGRSVADQFNAVTYNYEDLIQQHLRDHVNSKLPLNYTKNLFFHRVSEFHAQRDAPAKTIPGLFKYDEAPAESPVWKPLHFFIEHELQEVLEEYEAHITKTLRSWVEWGDTGKIARKMIATLHRCNFDRDELTDYQHDPNR